MAFSNSYEHLSFKQVEFKFSHINVTFFFNASAKAFTPSTFVPLSVTLFISSDRCFNDLLTCSISPKAYVAFACILFPVKSMCSIDLFRPSDSAMMTPLSSLMNFLDMLRCFRTVFGIFVYLMSTERRRTEICAGRSLRPEMVYSGLLIFYKASLTMTPKTPFLWRINKS